MKDFHPHSQHEQKVLERRRLHGGIFVLPVLTLIVVLIPELFLIALLEKIFASFAQMGVKGGQGSAFPLYAFMLFVGVLPALGVLAVTFFAYLKSEVILTKERLLFRTGLLSRTSGELPLENVEVIFISESLLGRLLGYGTVTVTSVGGMTFPLAYMARPQQFHAVLQEAVASAKMPRRVVSNTAPVPQAPVQDDSRYMPKF